MRMIGRIIGVFIFVVGQATAGAGQTVKFTTPPTASRAGGAVTVKFAVSAKTDVEVAIVGGDGVVVRHLAAGVLGGKVDPPAPLKPGLSQTLTWDGKDDYGEPVADAAGCSARVRIGMAVKLDRIVGGDPYAYWSEHSFQGDHALWRVTGLEAKSDGNVYLIGNVNAIGGPTIRRYSADGEYQRTVFPPAADKPVEDVKGWGVIVKPDGTFMLMNNDQWASPALSTTLICATQASVAALLPSADAKTLTLVDHQRFGRRRDCMTLGVDGTLRRYRTQPLVSDPPMPARADGMLDGPGYSALSPDGKTRYLSGLYLLTDRRGRTLSKTSFWRDGRVWKIDRATRKASVFFELDEKDVIVDLKARVASPIGHGAPNPYAAFQGVAVDADHHVFICDRQNKRIAVLDRDGKLLREIPVKYPDAVAVAPGSKALYVTTRYGDYTARGRLHLLKFNDWSKDDAPAVKLPLYDRIGKFREHSMLATVKQKDAVMVWVAYTTLPARVYRDTGEALELVKDFYQAGPQRALDLQHMIVDPMTDEAYISDGHGFCWKVADWSKPKFELCLEAPRKRLGAASIAIDARNRLLYASYRHQEGVKRHRMDGKFYSPAPVGKFGHQVTPRIVCSWTFGGNSERGMAVAPDGSLATLGVIFEAGNPDRRADNYSGPLHVFHPDSEKAPWEPVRIDKLGARPRTGSVRFDPAGNVYMGVYDRTVNNIPPAFAKDRNFRGTTGRIYKYAPTGSMAAGNLYPTAPDGPAKIYDVHVGPFAERWSRNPRFGVDAYGRIYYPLGLAPRVSVIDNAGSDILAFGTYGNRDSMGGLEGDLVPTKDVPMAWPSSVDATDDYIYVSDIVNARLLRLAKTFAAATTAEID